LARYGIDIICQTKVDRVTKNGVFLSNGEFLESHMIISTIGQTQINISGTELMGRDPEQRIILNSFLQVDGQSNIWGAGDAVHVNQPGRTNACPSNALWAIKQGELAGNNMARTFLSQSLKAFTYRGLGQCASLGIGKGMGELYGLPFTGWLAWIIRWFFFQYFMPSRKVMLREIIDWFHLLVNPGRKEYFIPEIKIYKPVIQKGIMTVNINQAAYLN